MQLIRAVHQLVHGVGKLIQGFIQVVRPVQLFRVQLPEEVAHGHRKGGPQRKSGHIGGDLHIIGDLQSLGVHVQILL